MSESFGTFICRLTNFHKTTTSNRGLYRTFDPSRIIFLSKAMYFYLLFTRVHGRLQRLDIWYNTFTAIYSRYLFRKRAFFREVQCTYNEAWNPLYVAHQRELVSLKGAMIRYTGTVPGPRVSWAAVIGANHRTCGRSDWGARGKSYRCLRVQTWWHWLIHLMDYECWNIISFQR